MGMSNRLLLVAGLAALALPARAGEQSAFEQLTASGAGSQQQTIAAPIPAEAQCVSDALDRAKWAAYVTAFAAFPGASRFEVVQVDQSEPHGHFSDAIYRCTGLAVRTGAGKELARFDAHIRKDGGGCVFWLWRVDPPRQRSECSEEASNVAKSLFTGSSVSSEPSRASEESFTYEVISGGKAKFEVDLSRLNCVVERITELR